MAITPWLAAVTAIVLAGQILQTWAAFLNLGRMDGELPAEFTDIFSPRDYTRSQNYTRAQTRFELLQGWFWTLVILAALWGNAFNHLDIAVRGLNLSETATGLIFLAGIFLIVEMLELPFDVYHTFRLEERFGMNRTTAATFVADKIKGALLTLILCGVLAWPVLALLQAAGYLAWLYCTLAFGIFMLLMQYIGPSIILPLFNKFEPIEDGDLREDIFDLAAAAEFPLKDIYIVDGSKRSSKGNAFFAGFGKSRRIGLFDTLINRLTRSEILAVLAHEMGHFRLRHVHKGFVSLLVKAGLMFILLNIFINYPQITKSLGMKHHSVHASLVFFGLLYFPLVMLLSIYGKWKSRGNEYEADTFAAGLRPPGSLVSALKKLSRNNLGNLTPHPVFVFLHFSHPPVLQRIRNLEGMNNQTQGRGDE
jgi:STE24 endopeptidase